MVNVVHDREVAKSRLQGCLIVGLMVTVVGVVIAAASNPHTEIQPFTGGAVEKGSEFGYLVGLIAVGVGSTLIWVAVIAWAVSLGIRLARLP